MRILHVLDHSIPLHSGYSFRTRAILEQQRALGWETEQVTGPKQGRCEDPVEEVEGFRFHRTPAVAGSLLPDPIAVIRAMERRLGALIPALRPDVIHAHSPALNGVAALRAARRHGVPVVYEVRAFWEDAAVDHGTTSEGSLRYRLTRALESWVLRRVDAVTCICEGLRGEIVARGVAPERVTVIPNAVDPQRFATDLPRDTALANELGLGKGPVLGFIGSFYGYEGLDLLIDALPMIREAHPDARVLLVGGGPQAENLREQASRFGLPADAVVFTGRVPHEDITRYYGLVDVLVYPRRSMRLTELVTPLKPLEAMAQRRLVAASDIGGHRELIEDGRTGVLFRAGDATALARSVGELLSAQGRWPALRDEGRRFVERERSWAASVSRYSEVYSAIAPAATSGTQTQESSA
ncbi:MAG: glycosyltransferase, exosortase A system-associated [Spiribacter salinus]|uniref:Glycosyltransferase, exosortase A system-associated n=1 Tax=Spiribacter salinus TaxID=1335746 RepID=A0A540VS96_9GAMM|nr:MAG: glycosyltransferase, exosortase A system-associated [Spiribacter salinus]